MRTTTFHAHSLNDRLPNFYDRLFGQQPGDGRQPLRSDGVLQTSGDLRGQGDNLAARGCNSKKCKHACACASIDKQIVLGR